MNSAGAVEEAIPISSSNIAWPQDKGVKFKNMAGAKADDQWADIESGRSSDYLERFIVWMRPAVSQNFRKLWGNVETNLKVGKHRITISNNWPVSGFGAEKYVVLSQAKVFGGKNEILSWMYIVFGGVMLLTAVIFGIRKAGRSKGILETKLK